ncbi:MAG: DUF3293 domain-containing protein [Wenzhouxiangellaceae bacterium]
MGPSRIDQDVIAAYRAAEYRVEDGFVLMVDQPSSALAAWQAAKKVSCSALITACNPVGQQVERARNQEATADLRAWLEKQNFSSTPAAGQDPQARWPEEPGFLIAGLALVPARELGRRFDQNAIVWAGSDAIPRLILLR